MVIESDAENCGCLFERSYWGGGGKTRVADPGIAIGGVRKIRFGPTG